MARKKTPGLTDAELKLMDVLWDRGEATVSEVVASLTQKPPLAYSTVLTTLRILENKGYARHTKQGRAFVYRAVVGRDKARQKAVTHLLGRFFEGSPGALVLNLLEARKIDAESLDRLRKRIEDEGA